MSVEGSAAPTRPRLAPPRPAGPTPYCAIAAAPETGVIAERAAQDERAARVVLPARISSATLSILLFRVPTSIADIVCHWHRTRFHTDTMHTGINMPPSNPVTRPLTRQAATSCDAGCAGSTLTNQIRNRETSILFVEDDDDIREHCAKFLEQAGFHVIQAGDGAAALRFLERGLRPALIVLDLIMPNMNGWEFRRAQIQNPRFAKSPVLLMSGAHQMLIDPAMKGISGYLRKPVHLEDLLSAVEAHAK